MPQADNSQHLMMSNSGFDALFSRNPLFDPPSQDLIFQARRLNRVSFLEIENEMGSDMYMGRCGPAPETNIWSYEWTMWLM